MKSFRFYATHQPEPVLKRVGEYSEAEISEFVNAFANDLARRRKLTMPIVLYGVIWAMAALGGRFILGMDMATTFAIHGFAVLGFALISGVWGHPRCPACHNEINQSIGDYCPECGSEELNRDQWLYIQCESCSQKLERWQKHTYTTRFCSHCGIPLESDAGTQ